MLHYLRASELWLHPILAATMYADRRKQFSERLKWPVTVDSRGFERDVYDQLNPLYAIIEGDDGRHAGSMRFLPTTGPTMVNDCFQAEMIEQPIRDPRTWECTRLCIAPDQDYATSIKLLVAGASLMREVRLHRLIAVLDDCTHRFYQENGATIGIIGSYHYKHGEICAGFLTFDDSSFDHLLELSGIDPLEPIIALANCNFSDLS